MEQETQIPALLQSSQDPTQVANTVKGLVLGLSGIVLTIAQVKGWTITASQVTVAATEVGAAAGAIWALWGLGMKVLSLFNKKTPVQAQ